MPFNLITSFAQVRRRVAESDLADWVAGWGAPDDIHLSPPDLRAADQGFVDELKAGTMGLAATSVHLGSRSPFAVQAPNDSWLTALESFAWLRHLASDPAEETGQLARRAVNEWISLRRHRPRLSRRPDVQARRILSWLAHIDLILDENSRRAERRVLRTLAAEIDALWRARRRLAPGATRLNTTIALLQAEIAAQPRARRLARLISELAKDLDTVVLSDGGARSRNTIDLVEMLLDLLPLRQSFAVAGLAPPPTLVSSIERMSAMVRYMRHRDGTLARFNGVGVTARDALASVLAIDEGQARVATGAPQFGYVRLEAGTALVIADTGARTATPADATFHGCLAFEFSDGTEILIASAGAPERADQRYATAARAISAHAAMSLGEAWAMTAGAVQSGIENGTDGPVLRAAHDGFLAAHQLMHHRTLHLAADGDRLEGEDILRGRHGPVRFSRDVPFAIHFPVHPDVRVDSVRKDHEDGFELATRRGARWRFFAEGNVSTTVESCLYMTSHGAIERPQIVVRGATNGEATVTWRFTRLSQGSTGGRVSRHGSLREALETATEASPRTDNGLAD
jgi:uncharacterized heparinase superfamily protein